MVLFPLSVFEGPMVTILAGFVASLGYANPFLIYAIVVVGDICGDCIWYAGGRWGLQGFVGRLAKRVGLTPERCSLLENHFEKHGGKTLVIGKLMHGVGPVALMAAGVGKVRPRKFILYNLLATMPKSLGLLLFGYFFGKAYGAAGSVLNYVGWAMIALVVLGGVAYLYFVPRRFARRVLQIGEQ